MKKFCLALIVVLAMSANALAWDILTYPIGRDVDAVGAPDMRAAVMREFVSEAIVVEHNRATETDERIALSKMVLSGSVNQNMISLMASTNPTIAGKITASDAGYVADIAYVVKTAYSPTITTPLFTIVANSYFVE